MAGTIINKGPLTVEVFDMEKVIAALGGVDAKLRRAAEVAAKEEAHRILRLTKHRVPYHRGELSKSGHVEGPNLGMDDTTYSIVYGGPVGSGGENTVDVDYAVIVHEDLAAKHLFGRTAKYVENPLREEMESGRSMRMMGETITREMGW